MEERTKKGGHMMEEREIYTCAAGETFDSVSLVKYGHARYAGKLMETNGKHAHLLAFRGGEMLIVPEIKQKAASTLPPWKRRET